MFEVAGNRELLLCYVFHKAKLKLKVNPKGRFNATNSDWFENRYRLGQNSCCSLLVKIGPFESLTWDNLSSHLSSEVVYYYRHFDNGVKFRRLRLSEKQFSQFVHLIHMHIVVIDQSASTLFPWHCHSKSWRSWLMAVGLGKRSAYCLLHLS